MHTDPRIDAYIEKSAGFAQPVLRHLRKLVHQAEPEIIENIKWGMPFFEYKGSVCNMAAFKQHCTFGFWKSSLLPDPNNLLKESSQEAMGQLGRITSLADLPDDEVIISYIKNAVQLNEEGKKAVKKAALNKSEVQVPDFLTEALKNDAGALENFSKFSSSHKREYIEWLLDAKTEATRLRRLNTAIEWLSAGKPRNWKYQS